MKARTLVVILILIGQLTISSIDSWDESKEPLSDSEELIFTTGGSNGADAELVGIISPKETVCNPTCRNLIYAGDATTFEVYIQNSGDQPLTEMGYKVQVWIADGNGNPLMLAKDASGADIEFDNPDVICDDVSVCDDQSLAAGAVFKGGKTTIQYGGGDATWTPAAGIYVIQIETYSSEDVDPGNDVQQVYVEVVDYLDIEIDIEWDDGSTVASGSGAQAFTVSVELGGSTDYTTHNLTMEIDVNGYVSQATASDGTDLLAASLGSLVHSVNVGQDQTVVVFQNETDLADSVSEVRTVFSSNVNSGVWTYSGTISPDTSVSNPIYSIDVALGEYTLFGQFESCISGTIDIYSHYCEETFTTDTFTDDNSDSIIGVDGVLDNIALTSLDVFMGYNSDGTGVATSSYKYGSPQTLDVGIAYIDATIEHQGSSLTNLYDWSVDFTITNVDTGEITEATETSCLQGVDPSYSYAKLGVGSNAYVSGHACTFVEFDVGTYSVEAELIMGGSKTDQFLSNNELTYEFVVENRLPVIRSLELKNEGDLVLGMESMLEFEASVFDPNDLNGEGLTYTWVGGAESVVLAGCGGMGGVARTCTTPIIQDFVTTFPVVVNITDAHGGEVSEEIIIEIWNDVIATDTTDSGIRLDYALTYFSKAEFSISVDDVDTATCSGITLPDGYGGELSGSYSPIALLDYSPVSNYATADVLTQSLDVTFDSSLGATSLWYTTNCNNPALTQLIADGSTTSADDSTKSVLSGALSGGTLPAGQLMLISSPLQAQEPPSASIGSFYTQSLSSGIHLTWGISGTMTNDDMIIVTITNTETMQDHVNYLPAGSINYLYGDALEDVTYEVKVEVCNVYGLCSTPYGLDTVIGAEQLNAYAVNVNVELAGENYIGTFAGPVFEINWDVSGTAQSVQSWMICGRQLEPSLQYNSGACYSTTAQGSITEPFRFNHRIPDQYSEATIETFFTVFAVHSSGIYNFNFTDEAANSIGSIVYDKSDYRPGKWGQEQFSSIDCDYEYSSNTHLICNDGGRFTGGDIFLQKDQTLTLGGEWDVASDQRIRSQDKEPEWVSPDFSMYQFAISDASGTPTYGSGEDLVYVALEAGDDLSWSTIIVQMTTEGGAYIECTNPDKSAGTGCTVSDNGDGKWAFGEEVTISEGSDDICSGSCTVQVKILQRGSNKVIHDSRQTTETVVGHSAVNFVNFSNLGSDSALDISCHYSCLFQDSTFVQFNPYEFGLFADISIDNSSFDFKQNLENAPHFATKIYTSPNFDTFGNKGGDSAIPSSISDIDQTHIFSADQDSEYTSESIWGLYLDQGFHFCIQSPEINEYGDRELDLRLFLESLDSQKEGIFLTISDETGPTNRLELRADPMMDGKDSTEFLCVRQSDENSQTSPVLLSLYNLSGDGYNRTISLEYHTNNSWGTQIQSYELLGRYFELTMPYVVMSTHSIDQVKHFSSSKFESFVRIENPTQFDYEIDLECIATKENKVVYNNHTKVIPANQTLLQVIEWSLEQSGQYELSCNAPTHPYYPDQFIGVDGKWNQDNTSEVAFVIIEKQPEEGFLGSNSIITYSLAGIGSLVCAVIVLLVVRRFRSDEDEEDEEEDEYEYDYNQYSNAQTPSMVNLPLGGGYDESEGATVPPYSFEGFINEDGYEVCEYPVGSGDWFWKNHETQEWVFWE